MKSKEQILAEALDHLQRKLEKLHADKLMIQLEIERTEELIKTMPKIYE